MGRERLMLAGAVLYWPTPTARDWKDGACAEANVPTNGLLGRLAPRMMPSGGGGMVLNPRFVEALMGWPIGWTSCVSAVEASCHSKPLTPLNSCMNG